MLSEIAFMVSLFESLQYNKYIYIVTAFHKSEFSVKQSIF